MKKNIKAVLLIAVMANMGCTKSPDLTKSASIIMANTLVGSDLLAVDFGKSDTLHYNYSSALKLNYGGFVAANEIGGYSGPVNLSLYQFPDTLSHNEPLYQFSLNLEPGSMHTLFLTGVLSAPDTLLTSDHPPYHGAADSSVGVRFINLSPGIEPVSVNISGGTPGSEVAGFGFKSVTEFKSYPATKNIASYTFEFRKVSDNTTVIATYKLNNINAATNALRYRNVTVLLFGVYGGSGSSVLRTGLINNY